MKKYIFPSNEDARKNKQYKSYRVNHLFNLWRYFESRIHHMNPLIHENYQTTSAIKCWKRKQIKDSETQ